MIHRGLLVAVGTLMLVVATWAVAAPPILLTYQGALTDAAGNPANAAYSMTFGMYHAATGGAPLWSETIAVVKVVNGVFTVALGGTTPLPAGLTNCKYLQVSVAGAPMLPRHRLTSVPYALEAANATTLGGQGSAYYRNATNLNSGAVAPARLPVNGIDSSRIKDGNVKSADLASGAVTAAKIAGGAVTASKLAVDSVTGDKVFNESLTEVDLADGAVTASRLAPDSVTGDKVLNESLTEVDLADFAVTAGKLAPDSVNGVKVADGSLTAADLASGAVTAAKIAGGAVTAGKLATDSVTGVKVADGSLTAADLADGAVTAGKLAPDSVTGLKVADGSLTADDLAAGAVGTTQLADSAVTAAKVADGSLTAADLADGAVTGPKISIGQMVEGNAGGSGSVFGARNTGTAMYSSALLGVSTGSAGTTYGVEGQTASTSGTAVRGYASAVTGSTYGVLGATLSNSGTGVYGGAVGSGNTVGILGYVQSPNGKAVVAFSEDFNAYGLYVTQGKSYFGGYATFAGGHGDLAENYRGRDVEAGDVVVIGEDGVLVKCAKASDATVAGIVSTSPSMKLSGRLEDGDGVVPLALVGRVACKVDASERSITPGDLLVTSDRPGHAMKCPSKRPAAGAVLGKALEGLDKGTGVIQVLVTLR